MCILFGGGGLMMNWDDDGDTTDADGLGTTVFIRTPIVESRGAHVRRRCLARRRSRTLPLPSIRMREFSFRSVWSSIIEASPANHAATT